MFKDSSFIVSWFVQHRTSASDETSQSRCTVYVNRTSPNCAHLKIHPEYRAIQFHAASIGFFSRDPRVDPKTIISASTGHVRCPIFSPWRILFSDPGIVGELSHVLPSAADRPMHRVVGAVCDFSFLVRPLCRYLRVSSTATAVTETTPYTSSCLVGDTGSPHSRATTARRRSRRGGVTANAPLLISVFRFFFAQPAKMVWITVDDQVPSLYDRDRSSLLFLFATIF